MCYYADSYQVQVYTKSCFVVTVFQFSYKLTTK